MIQFGENYNCNKIDNATKVYNFLFYFLSTYEIY